ncbi:MAG: acylphosphatase [Bacteroidota bacterium]
MNKELPIRHIKIVISGHVQGVSFRWEAKREADLLGVSGYVRNNYDGSVYIEAEGTPDQLDAFIAWCHQGPSGAIVEEVNVSESKELQNYKSFLIRT